MLTARDPSRVLADRLTCTDTDAPSGIDGCGWSRRPWVTACDCARGTVCAGIGGQCLRWDAAVSAPACQLRFARKRRSRQDHLVKSAAGWSAEGRSADGHPVPVPPAPVLGICAGSVCAQVTVICRSAVEGGHRHGESVRSRGQVRSGVVAAVVRASPVGSAVGKPPRATADYTPGQGHAVIMARPWLLSDDRLPSCASRRRGRWLPSHPMPASRTGRCSARSRRP